MNDPKLSPLAAFIMLMIGFGGDEAVDLLRDLLPRKNMREHRCDYHKPILPGRPGRRCQQCRDEKGDA